MRSLQVGVIGSSSDLKYSKAAAAFAGNIGELIAREKYVLVYGAEKDVDSLPTIAALAARKAGGMTVGVTYEKGLQVFNDEAAAIVIATGLVRGGGRETTLMLSCDVVIALSGGSGTLNEICVAYQANIPVVVVPNFNGWSEKLANSFLDSRNRYKFIEVSTPADALRAINSMLVR